MASVSIEPKGAVRAGAVLLACVEESGSFSHPWRASEALVRGPESPRNLADAVHFLALLHGRHPGVIDIAAGRCGEPQAREWLRAAADASIAERAYLTKLAVAAGPVPGTPGGGGSEATVVAQRAALATLAGSERRGCALGAALAFAADWASVRVVLDHAAGRLGIAPPPFALGDAPELAALADACAAPAPALERAMLFGAGQLALQHRGLWDLLEARRQARTGG